MKKLNCFYSSLSLLKPRAISSIHAEAFCVNSLAKIFPRHHHLEYDQRDTTNFRNIVYNPSFSFGSTPKQSPFRPKSTWPLQNFKSFTEYLNFIEAKPDLKEFLSNEENAQRILNSFWQLLENEGKIAEKALDKDAIKAFKLLYHQKILPLTEFTRLEKAFLLPGKLATLTVYDYHELLTPFVNYNIGTRDFYNTLSDSVIEKAKKNTNNRDFLRVLPMFTKANAYSNSFRDWTIDYLKSLISNKGNIKGLSAELLGSMSFFMALEYDKTKFLHEQFYEAITEMLKERKDDFYTTIRKIDYLRYIWNLLQSTQIYDKELFGKLSKAGVLKKMPFVRKGTTPSEGHQEIFEELLKIADKDKEVAVEKRIGVYFVDIFVGPDIVIEVNSFRHYFDFGTRRSGAYEIKHRNLNAMGYKIKELDLKDWYDVPREKKAEYLKDCLKNGA